MSTLKNTYIIDYNTGEINHEPEEKTEPAIESNKAKFSDFKLCLKLLKGVYEAGFESPSLIQKVAIPEILKGSHILARAKNGTGKTEAFAIPLLERVDRTVKKIQVVAVVPSRELALQTHKVFKKLAKHLEISIEIAIGGTSFGENRRLISKMCQVLVGTPGRLFHLANTIPEKFSPCRALVIDEADTLLASHYEGMCEKIVGFASLLNENTKIILFSATFPAEVKKFQEKHMPGAVTVNTTEILTLKGVTPFYILLEENQKLNALLYLLKNLTINQSMIFVNSSRRAENLFMHLHSKNYSCSFIHSKMSHSKTDLIYRNFRDGKFKHLITTNSFKRELDVMSVNVMVNFDFPTEAEEYLHRIGRSGRFEQKRISVEFVREEDKLNFYRTEDRLSIEIEQLPENIGLELYN